MNYTDEKFLYKALATCDMVTGELENNIMDGWNEEESEALLNNHEELVKRIYDEALTNDYNNEGSWAVTTYGGASKHWRFLGKDRLMELCDYAVTFGGY